MTCMLAYQSAPYPSIASAGMPRRAAKLAANGDGSHAEQTFVYLYVYFQGCTARPSASWAAGKQW